MSRCTFHGQTFDDLLRRCAHLGERYIVELDPDNQRVFAPPGHIVQCQFTKRGYLHAVDHVALDRAEEEWKRRYNWLIGKPETEEEYVW